MESDPKNKPSHCWCPWESKGLHSRHLGRVDFSEARKPQVSKKTPRSALERSLSEGFCTSNLRTPGFMIVHDPAENSVPAVARFSRVLAIMLRRKRSFPTRASHQQNKQNGDQRIEQHWTTWRVRLCKTSTLIRVRKLDTPCCSATDTAQCFGCSGCCSEFMITALF